MLYIRRLIICDETDNNIYDSDRIEAERGLIKALDFVRNKGGSYKHIMQRIGQRLDDEFKQRWLK